MSDDPLEVDDALDVDDPMLPSAVEAVRLEGLLSEVGALESQVARLQALQVQRTAEFVEGYRFLVGEGKWWTAAGQQLVATDLAAARGVSVHAAERYMWDAIGLVDDLPAVLGVLESGQTSLQAVRAVVAEVRNLMPETLPLADEILAADIVTVLPSRVRALARTRVFELDPDAAADAAIDARNDRMVVLSDAVSVGMANLTAVLPAEQAAACHVALDSHARGLRQQGDQRTVSQIMADTLVQRVTGQAIASGVPVSVGLVMSDTTLLGIDDQPAQLPGLGPIPAPIARWLTSHDSTWVRRLYTDPVDATVTMVDTRRRRFDGALREFCLARDQRCRAPGCTAKIRDIDHTLDHSQGGETTASNGRGYSERCHRMKHHPAVTVTTAGLATDSTTGYHAYTRWAMPTGRQYGSIPPPALGPGTTTRQQAQWRREITHQLETTTHDWVWPTADLAGSTQERRVRRAFTLGS